MFKRGDVVQHKYNPDWRGVVVVGDRFETRAVVQWFDGSQERNTALNDDLRLMDGYEFERALIVGDAAKVIALYRAEQARANRLTAALTPFARFGKLQHRYKPEAIFTIAYDRNGREVKIMYADVFHAAEALPDVEIGSTGAAAQGGAGGIAEIMEVKA